MFWIYSAISKLSLFRFIDQYQRSWLTVLTYLPQVGHFLSAAGSALAFAAGAAPAPLNFGRPKPTIEIITPSLFFLKARSCLHTSPPFLWLPFFFEEVFPSIHQTVPSSLSLTTIPT
jgi:hypothetical protein